MLLVQVARIFHLSLAHLTHGGSGFESMPVITESGKIKEIEENAGAEQSTILRGY